jgi:hypothetical protein
LSDGSLRRDIFGVKVLIVDDQTVVRAGIRRLLESVPGISIVDVEKAPVGAKAAVGPPTTPTSPAPPPEVSEA